ncbi:MAG TPA: glycosyl hydrolase 53 family protein [Candidatus Polarisedimenticolia bacterium]|nr:glycosyl hydrolase 53 family protein [Candidatus Polarisedimenticolia bacterium]
MKWVRIISVLCIIAAVFFAEAARAQTNCLAATDFSDLAFFESRGVTYKDHGQVMDGLQILKNHGFNCIRLRLWTSSASQAASDPYNYGNNLAYTIPLAVRVKNAGLMFSLDFHYSDTWADPGKQATPSAWTNLTFAQLVDEMRFYNSNTIAAFAAAGAMPDFVQIGNEITAGMLWPSGKVSRSAGSWPNLGQLMKSAVRGIQDASTALHTNMPKIIVHIDRGADWATTEWFFDNLNAQGVPYDIIGESYYPFFHGPLANLNTCLSNTAVRYSKPVIVAENAFPWTNSVTSWTNKLYGFAPTVDGQVSFIAALAQVVKSVPHHLGMGVFYWGAEYQLVNGVNEAGFNTTALFDSHGNLLPAADGIAGMAAPLVITPSLAGTNLQLEWPFSGAAARLVVSSNIGPAAIWSSTSNTASVTGTALSVTVPLSNKSGFYRLQAP